MRVFLSHSSLVKPLVREVRSYLPEHVNSWIDEKELVVGDSLQGRIRTAIKAESDFLVVFIDDSVAGSEWVQKELEWAFEQESFLGRPFVLPIVVSEASAESIDWLRDRIFLRCSGFSESDVRRLATDLSSSLFSLLSRDLDRLREPREVPATALDVLDSADRLLKSAAHIIRPLVLPHRRENPLRLSALFEQLTRNGEAPVASATEFNDLLFRLRERKLLAGVVISAGSIYVEEEHLNWRLQEAVAAKQAAADHVVEWIVSGSVVFVDGGSTALRIAKNITQGVRFLQWDKLTVVTNSAPALGEFAEVANDLGMEDFDPRLQVYAVGGRMRMNAATVVASSSEPNSIDALASRLGGFDIAFCGTNGISWPEGCTTTAVEQAHGKHAALMNARRRVIIADSSKYDARQEQVFADFSMGLEIVTPLDAPDSRVEEYSQLLKETDSKINRIRLS